MKKIAFLALVFISLLSCKQTEWAPEGPTDVRVRNLQGDMTFTNVVIKTAGGRDTTGNIKSLGTILPGDTSVYQRVEVAYPKAEIIAEINGITFSTGEFLSTYMQYIGQQRITYEVYVSNLDNKILKINNVVYDEPLVLK
ncbi:MAG: hypothetical protein JXR66_12525 [Bacteroidales bacterium]|nr:hypothetical protein [Bacteroidales bacterium]MBN2634378.1 hypothetical protein [Bacteroidales bacterium]